MKWVSSGCSSHIHSYALFFHSIPAGFLWIYTIWIKLANNNSPCLFHFAGFSKLILLLRPSLILAEIVGRNFLKTIKYVLLKLSTHAHHALLIWKKNAYFSSFLCILQDKKPWGNESTFSVINHCETLAFQIQLSPVHTKMALEFSISHQIDHLKKNLLDYKTLSCFPPSWICLPKKAAYFLH